MRVFAWPMQRMAYSFSCLTFSPSALRLQPLGRLQIVRAASTEQKGDVTSENPRLGFLGLGIMGTAMARNLLKAGYDVTVWNRTSSKCEALVNEGAKHGSSPKQVTEQCDITFAMLADPKAALEVALGADGAVEGLSVDKGYVDISTVDAETSKTVCDAVKSSGSMFLEAPVSGSKKPAEDGKLIFLTAGDKELFLKAEPMLDVMGKSKFYLGEVGNGAAMKLIVNMIMGSMMAAFSEGLTLGEKSGLDPETVLEVVSQGAINSPMFSLKGPSMLRSEYSPAFPLKHQQKDLRLALELSERLSQSIPVAAAANEMYKKAKAGGWSDHDFSAVIEAFKSQLK